MAKANTFFRVQNKLTGQILSIKKLTPQEVKAIYTILKAYVVKNNQKIDAPDYFAEVLKHTLKNYDKFISKQSPNPNKLADEIDLTYGIVITFYPLFELTATCIDINSDLLTDEASPVYKDKSFEDFIKLLNGCKYTDKMGFDTIEGEGIPMQIAKLTHKRLKINNKEDILKFRKYLSKNIIGQEGAIEAVVDTVKLIASKLSKSSSMFFIGPTGVGKTELAKLLGEKYSGNFMKVNCAEYAGAHEYSKLIGSPPGYVGHSDKSILAQKAGVSNRWVFLFDEVEKANDKLFDFLLALLDTGSVTDNSGNVLDFSESVFIFTSNQGVSDIRVGANLGFGDSVVTYTNSIDMVKESVVKKFSPEFINRIDSFVYFNSLTKQDAKDIVNINLKELPIIKSDKLANYIVEKAFSEQYGARAIKRFIKNTVMVKLADKILDYGKPLNKDDLFEISIMTGEMVVNKVEKIGSALA